MATHGTGFVYEPIYLQHKTGAMHPEHPRRLTAIYDFLAQSGLLQKLKTITSNPIALEWLREIHTAEYIAHVREVCEKNQGYLDSMDTEVSARSYEAALHAAGGVAAAADAVSRGEVRNAFCAVRPPGHHAVSDRAMGFCLFNNIAVAARYLQKKHNYERILIVDWDVHHGNGTQDAFYDDPTVFYFSTHQYPHYPGSGAAQQRGSGKGDGCTLNVPMAPGAGDEHYLRAFEEQLTPAAREFKPDFILVSAGFDFHESDPLSSIIVTYDGFQRISEIVVELAETLCGGRLVSALEGGYALQALTQNVALHPRTLLAP